jgi:GT2 family glycosyltransferase
MSRIAVVVVNWNRRELLANCLESLRRQRGVPSFEVVLVDNGSTDGSVEMVRRHFPSIGDGPVRIIANAENRGFCAANNQGFAATGSPLVALLNNDAEAEPGWLAALESALDGRPEVGMAASKILVWEDPRRIDKVGHLIYLDGQNRGRGTGQLDRGQFDRLEEVIWPDGCACVYRREVINCIGGFDEDFFAYGDDAEFGLRAQIAGWSCLYVPDAVVRHHRGATLGVTSSFRLELIERNRLLLAVKLFPWSLLCLNGVFTLARILAGLRAAAMGQGEVRRFPGLTGKLALARALARGAFQALMMVPRMLRKRGQVNRYRKLSPAQVRRLILRHRISLRELSESAV